MGKYDYWLIQNTLKRFIVQNNFIKLFTKKYNNLSKQFAIYQISTLMRWMNA